MLEVFFLSFALSMDVFVVSLGLGTKYSKNQIKKIAIFSSSYFALFQGLMPLIGFLLFSKLSSLLDNVDHWIAFFLLLGIGVKMIYDSFSNKKIDFSPTLSHKVLFVLAIATSIDALAAGFTLNLMSISPYISVCIIAIVTFVVGYIGIFIGSKFGLLLEKKAGILGGAILIGIGIKILIEHLY